MAFNRKIVHYNENDKKCALTYPALILFQFNIIFAF